MSSSTTKLNLTKPSEGSVGWASSVNANWDALDTTVVSADSSGEAETLALGQVKFFADQTHNKLAFYVKMPTSGDVEVGTL